MHCSQLQQYLWTNATFSEDQRQAICQFDVLCYWVKIIDIEYNKRLDRQRPCLEGDLTAGSNL